jgi:hypothetical protein
MTAMRTKEHGIHQTSNPMSISSSYDTASPQQLESVGILPVVIKDKARRRKQSQNKPKNVESKKQLKKNKLFQEQLVESQVIFFLLY